MENHQKPFDTTGSLLSPYFPPAPCLPACLSVRRPVGKLVQGDKQLQRLRRRRRHRKNVVRNGTTTQLKVLSMAVEIFSERVHGAYD